MTPANERITCACKRARIRFFDVFRFTRNVRFKRFTPQLWVNPRKSNVSGFPSPRRCRSRVANRPNSISRVFSGCSCKPNFPKIFQGVSRNIQPRGGVGSPARNRRHNARRRHRPWHSASATAAPRGRRRSEGHIGEQRRDHRPCPVPLSSTVTTPSSSIPALSHFWIRRMIRSSPIRCSTNLTSHSWLTAPKKFLDVGVKYPVHLPFLDRRRKREPAHHAGSSSRSKPVGEATEVAFIDRVESMTVAPWTILSSRAAMASGRCLPSAFGYLHPGERVAVGRLLYGPVCAGPRAGARGLPRSPPT